MAWPKLQVFFRKSATNPMISGAFAEKTCNLRHLMRLRHAVGWEWRSDRMRTSLASCNLRHSLHVSHSVGWERRRPSWHQIRPDWHQMRPSWHQMRFNRHQKRPSWHQKRPNWHQMRPSWHEMRFNRHQTRLTKLLKRPRSLQCAYSAQCCILCMHLRVCECMCVSIIDIKHASRNF